MAIKLNLLPQDYTVSDSVAAVVKFARPLNVILLSIFLISALGASAFFIFSSVTMNKLNSENEVLKSKIQSQQSAQQQAVLLKDRLGKIKKVYIKPNAILNLTSVNPIITGLPESSSISELIVDFQKVEMSVKFTTNSDFKNFMEFLKTQSAFSNISIESIYYNGTDGYLVSFVFTGQVDNEKS